MSKKNKVANITPMVNKPVAFIILLIGSILFGFIISGLITLISWQVIKNTVLNPDILIGTLGFILIGYPVGNISGILILKKFLRLEGSLLWGIPLCLLGAIGALGLSEIFNISALVALIILAIVAPLSGTLGFLLIKRGRTQR